MRVYQPEPYRPINRRRRVLIAVLALSTALLVAWAVTRDLRPAGKAALPPADVAACTQGQTAGCVGSMTSVIAAPVSAASAAPAAAR